jgi:hypothetical protein
VYFAAKLADPAPSKIKAVEYRTNTGMPGDDTIELDLDLTGSLSDFNAFKINARGATNVYLSGGRAAKREWSGDFIAKSRITAEGWETEARVPWQLMRIPAGGSRDLRFNIGRYLSRESRDLTFKYLGNGDTQDTPIWEKVDLPGPIVDRGIKLLPYGYAGSDADQGLVANAGLDLKTQLAQDITLVGTVNPDFRNIENQILSLDFSRFERIADESRPFFQEGVDYMESALYASQRIGSFDAGVNSYGKINDKTQFGLIETIDFNHQNDFATNVTYNASPHDSYRATLSSLDEVGHDNQAYMFRYNRVQGNYDLFARTMGSNDTLDGFGADHDANISYSGPGVYAWGGYTYREAGFNPGLGYFPERDFKGFDFGAHVSRHFTHGALISSGGYASATSYDHVDGDFYRNDYSAQAWGTLRNQVGFSGGIDFSDFEGSNDHVFNASLSYPNNDPYRSQSISLQQGVIGGDEYRLLSIGSNLRPIKGFQLSLSHQSYQLGDHAEQTIVGASYDLGHDRNVSGRAVRHDGDVNWYVALRQSGNRGAEYYLIVGDPNAAVFRSSIVLKVAMPFEIGGSVALRERHSVG